MDEYLPACSACLLFFDLITGAFVLLSVSLTLSMLVSRGTRHIVFSRYSFPEQVSDMPIESFPNFYLS